MSRTEKNNKGGFSFLEIMGGVFIVTVGVVAIANLVTNLFLYSRFLSSKLTAAYLTQEGMEIVRNIRDTNWLEGENWEADIFCCATDPGQGCPGVCECTREKSGACRGDYGDAELETAGGGRLYRQNGRYVHGGGEKTEFKRFIEVEKSSPDFLEVCVITTWEAQVTGWAKEHETRACEKLYNWYYESK